tara:strand:+ start:142 stop:300 length:159 start_codon:yes stop_codon:yes gene_type:complete
MLTFEKWCEHNGKRWIGSATHEEFESNARAYEAYREAYKQHEKLSEKTKGGE